MSVAPRPLTDAPPEAARELPLLGVGVGWEIGSEGLEWQDFFPQVAARARYVETAPLYDPRALDRVRRDLDADFRFVLHYSGLSLPGPTTRIAQHFPILDGLCRLLGSPWFVEDLGYWSVEGADLGAFLPLLLTEEALATSVRNMTALKAAVRFPYLPENPPFSAVLGEIHMLDFMARLSRATDTPYLLDVGHLYSYLSLVGEDPLAALERVEWERVLELHIAGGEMVRNPHGTGWIYDDNHSKPILPEVLDLLGLMLPRASAVRAVTVEIDTNQAATGVTRPVDVAVSNFHRTWAVAESVAPRLARSVQAGVAG